jgi:hypothetical protein
MLALDRHWAPVSLVAALSSLAAAQGPQQVFPGRCDYVGVYWPDPILLRDFDRDGHLDLLTGGSDELRLLHGDGAGGLGSGQTFPVSGSPQGLALGDFDEDGELDLASVIGGGSSFEVRWGDGSGGFAGGTTFPSGGTSFDVEVADLNGDGHMDVVLANPGFYPPQAEYTVSIVLGTGSGSFLAPRVHELGSGGDLLRPSDIALSDLDHDGDVDTVAGGWTGLAVLLNDGQGGVEQLLRYDLTNTLVNAVALGDLNGDGDLDVAAVGGTLPGGAIEVYLGSGDGTLALEASIATEIVGCLALGDIDGDGALDAVTGSQEPGSLQLFRGDGNGGLGAPQSWTTPNIRELALGDFDEDARLDLAATVGSHHVFVLFNDGQGGLNAPRKEAAPTGTCVTADDLNGDGRNDLAVSSSLRPRFLVRPAIGPGAFAPAVITPLSFLAHGHTVAELTGDAHADVLASDETNGDLVLLGGDGQCGMPELARWPGPGLWPCTPAVVDLDRDGDLDAALTSGQAGTLAVWLGDGHGGLIQSGTWSVGGEPTAVVASDFDEDGRADLLVCNAPMNGLTLLRGDGLGGFAAIHSFSCDSYAQAVAVGDLDLDGHRDVAVACADHRVRVLLGDGQGGLGTPTAFRPWIESLRAITCADVDGDLRPDVLVGAWGVPELSVLRGNGTGGLGSAVTFASSVSGIGNIALTDLDRDGRLDAVTSAPFSLAGLTIYTNLLPDLPDCTAEEVYCEAKLNSAGCLPRICSTGSPTLTGSDDFFVTAEQVVAHRPGMLVWSFAPTSLPYLGGLLCVAPPVVRTTPQDSGGTPGAHDCAGSYSYHLAQSYMAAHGLTPGIQLFGQYWSRDPGFPAPFDGGLTDALRVTIQP